MFDFEKFKVYQDAERIHTLIIKEILIDKKINRALKDQLNRASLSIVLNIAEGAGKFAPKDKRNFYTISRGSVNECVAIIRILRIEQCIEEKTFNELYGLLLTEAKMLTGLILKLK